MAAFAYPPGAPRTACRNQPLLQVVQRTLCEDAPHAEVRGTSGVDLKDTTPRRGVKGYALQIPEISERGGKAAELSL